MIDGIKPALKLECLFFFYHPFFQEWPGEVKFTENKYLIFMFLLNGFMFYMQSLTAFGLMSLISPVTFRFVFCLESLS